jgi:thymidylate synthase (FAD)
LNIPVLDKGYVKLINHMGTDMSPVMDARVSTATESNPTRDDALREYLWENRHTSPFESMVMQIELKVPLYILRQLERHRTVDNDDGVIVESLDENMRKWFSPNEQSGRYSVFEEEYYIPDEIKGQDTINKQGSSEKLDEELSEEFQDTLKESNGSDFSTYEYFIDKGVSKETARSFLHLNVYTTRRMTGSFLNWSDFLKQRRTKHAQREAKQYADAVYSIIQHLWPRSAELLEEYTFSGASLCRTDVLYLKELLGDPSLWEGKLTSKLGESFSARRLKKLISKLV